MHPRHVPPLRFDLARLHIERTRDLMSTDFAALVGESYERAYTGEGDTG